MSKIYLRQKIVESMREIVFGLEDSLVSTLGTITGIAIGSHNTYIVILSGLVLLASESVSMAVSSYLSDKSAFETEKLYSKDDTIDMAHDSHPVRAGVVICVFYIIGGFIPLTPYLLLPVESAMIISIALTAIVLFFLGVWTANFTKHSKLKGGLQMMIISLTAAFIGYIIGRVVSLYFGVNVL